MIDAITTRILTSSEIYPKMLDSFRHKQTISDKWVKSNGSYKLIKTNEVYEWSADKKIRISQYLYQQMNRGGFVVGAFFDNKMVGFSCLDGSLQGISEKYVNLTMLFVDDKWKRKGIGKE